MTLQVKDGTKQLKEHTLTESLGRNSGITNGAIAIFFLGGKGIAQLQNRYSV